MKRILIILFVLDGLMSYGQAKLDVFSSFSLTPVGANSPSSPVTYSTTVSLYVNIRNSGNTSFNGTFQVITKRDTLNGIILDTVSITQTIIAGGGTSTIITFTPSPGSNAFKSAGNGNTIVVWPLIVSGGGTNGDSLREVIWVNDNTSVFEFEKNQFKIYPNPVINNLTIKPINNINYKKLIVYDLFARKVKETAFKQDVDVSDLIPGSYWMIIYSEDKSYRVSFIKE